MFKKNNNLWKLAAHPGRKRMFENAEDLLSRFFEYTSWCDKNPWYKNEYKTEDKSLIACSTPTARPYTKIGFCVYLGVGESYFRDFVNGRKADVEFSTVIQYIETTIQQQQLEGAAVGTFNSNIISRLLGLVDKAEVKQTVITVEQEEPEEDDDV